MLNLNPCVDFEDILQAAQCIASKSIDIRTFIYPDSYCNVLLEEKLQGSYTMGHTGWKQHFFAKNILKSIILLDFSFHIFLPSLPLLLGISITLSFICPPYVTKYKEHITSGRKIACSALLQSIYRFILFFGAQYRFQAIRKHFLAVAGNIFLPLKKRITRDTIREETSKGSRD